MTVDAAWSAVAASFVLGAAAVVLLARVAARLPKAEPNDRSLHVRPVPRAGGYAIWIGFLPVALFVPPDVPGSLTAWLVPWLALVAVSARDDMRSVSVPVRLAVHLIAALWCAMAMTMHAAADLSWSDPTTIAAVVAITLSLAWSANLYNFMDGSDGLAATMTLVGFIAYAIASLWTGQSAAAYFALAAATLPFLVVNRPRATMFLGDVGSVPLGFLAAAFGAAGALTQAWPVWFPVLVFLPFIADATVTLARRAARGDRLSSAHKDHYYQRLHQLGAGHGGTLAAYTLLMLATSATALACLAFAPTWGVLALASWCVVCFVMFAAIDQHWRRRVPVSR